MWSQKCRKVLVCSKLAVAAHDNVKNGKISNET